MEVDESMLKLNACIKRETVEYENERTSSEVPDFLTLCHIKVKSSLEESTDFKLKWEETEIKLERFADSNKLENKFEGQRQTGTLPTESSQYVSVKEKRERSESDKLTYIRRQRVTCDKCHKTFSSMKYLKDHQKVHLREKTKHQCTICNKTFTTSYNLKIHGMVHSGEKPHSCDSCPKTFSTTSNLIEHKKIMHSEERPLSCGFCDKRFCRKSDLKVHSLSHSEECPHICEICQKGFKRLAYLKSHMKTHAIDKPYCVKCDRTFLTKQAMKKHTEIHVGARHNIKTKKLFSCEICGKSYTNSQNLKAHILRHTGERPFQCEICLKTFVQRRCLDNHINTHSGNKPFKCTICGKCSARKSDLKTHMRTHNGLKPYSCSFCSRNFSHSNSLTRHLAKKHN